MAVIDHGSTATLFLSNAGFGIVAPGQAVQRKATVLRLGLTIPAGQPPVVSSRTVIGSGFGAQADPSVFLIGPTGLTLGPDGTLYVSDAIGNRVVAIANAAARTESAGTGREISAGGLLNRPLAMDMAPDGHLLVVNGLNGQVVEIDPATGKQAGAMWIDTDEAQTPPGSGDLFGIAMLPAGNGFYYVEDDINTLMEQQ
jgi:DNA-binding beta-propeller fold protein YncE